MRKWPVRLSQSVRTKLAKPPRERNVTRHIGIVGAGIAGLHLALYLQKHGVDATLITDRAPDEYREHPAVQHGRASSCDDRARELSGRQSLEATRRITIITTIISSISRSRSVPWLFLQSEPGRRLSDLSPGADGRFPASRRQNRVSPDRGGRHRARWSPASICWWSRPARARSASSSPTGRSTRLTRSRSGASASVFIPACDNRTR